MTTRSLLLLVALLISPLCAAQSVYPREVIDAGASLNFPDEVAGYTRGRTFAYAQGMSNYSIGYNRFLGNTQHAVTIYLYEADAGLDQAFQAEIGHILGANPSAKLLAENKTQFMSVTGEIYEARVALFMYTSGQLSGSISELALIKHPRRFVKVRSTSSPAQADEARKGMTSLIEKLNWAY